MNIEELSANRCVVPDIVLDHQRPRGLAGRLDAPGRFVDEVEHLSVAGLTGWKGGRKAQRLREVPRPNEEDVEAIYGQDLVKIVHRLQGLDHAYEKPILVVGRAA